MICLLKFYHVFHKKNLDLEVFITKVEKGLCKKEGVIRGVSGGDKICQRRCHSLEV